MKASRYNYIFHKDGYSYWFNGISKSFFRLGEVLGKKLESALHTDLDLLALQSPSLYSRLSENNFIIEDDVDELAVIKERNEASINSKDYFLVILPTLNCNYSCWYCIQNHVPSSMKKDTMDSIKRHIDYMLDEEKIEYLHLDWFGGEPFMYFEKVIEPLTRYAIARCDERGVPMHVSSTTNGYFLTERVASKLGELRFRNFQITLDGDREHHDKVKFQKGLDSAFNHVLKNINNILWSFDSITINLRINYTSKTLSEIIVDQVNEYIRAEVRDRILITPRKVWQEKPDPLFVDTIHRILDRFSQAGYRVERWNPSNGFISCYANKKYYNAISYDGSVVKCTASDDLYLKEPIGRLRGNGSIEWRDNIDKKYIAPTWDRERCRTCKHLPVCMGLCPRECVRGGDYCKYDLSAENIEHSIVKFLEQEFK